MENYNRKYEEGFKTRRIYIYITTREAKRFLKAKLEDLESKNKSLELEASTLRETSKLVGEDRLTIPQLTKLVAKIKSDEIEAEVKNRLNEEFRKRSEEESSRKASEKLDQSIRIEWPTWYTTTVKPKIEQLEASAYTNALNFLKGPWTVICDKCGQSFRIDLTAENLGHLLSLRYIEVECRNPDCTDSFWLFTFRHKIKLSLKNLIEAQIIW